MIFNFLNYFLNLQTHFKIKLFFFSKDIREILAKRKKKKHQRGPKFYFEYNLNINIKWLYKIDVGQIKIIFLLNFINKYDEHTDERDILCTLYTDDVYVLN